PLRNHLLSAVIFRPVPTALALALAVFVNQHLRGVRAFRTIYFAPVVTVMAVAATVWRLLYAPAAGFITGLLGAVSGGAVHPNWLRNTSTAFLAIIIMSIWQGVGVQMVILLAGRQDIPHDPHE